MSTIESSRSRVPTGTVANILRRHRLVAGFAAIALLAAACGGGGTGTTAPRSQPAGSAPASPDSSMPPMSSPDMSPSGSPDMSPSGSPDMSPGGSPDGSPGEGSVIEPPATAVSLDYWTPFTGPDGDTMETLVERFNTETPNVQMALQRLDEWDTQLNNAQAAGELPEVMILRIDTVPFRAATEMVQPVTDLIAQLGVGPEDFTEAVWNGTMWKDVQYSVPIDIHPATLYWNRAILGEAGITEAPSDRESFEAALQACKDAGITGPVWSNHFFSASLFWASLFYQGGGEWTNEDFTEATFNSQAGVDATEYMVGLVEQGLHPRDAAADTEVSSFESGQSCMAITGIWQTNRFQAALGEAFGAAPIPQIFDQPGSWAGSHTLAVRNGLEGDELQGAYYFIDWLSRNTLEWAASGQIPARVDVREDPAFQEIPDVPDIAEGVEGAQYPPPIPGSGDLLGGPGGVTEKLLEALTGEGVDVQAALDDAAATYTQILNESKEQYDF